MKTVRVLLKRVVGDYEMQVADFVIKKFDDAAINHINQNRFNLAPSLYMMALSDRVINTKTGEVLKQA